jgi:serine/threonine protein kinase
VDVTLTRDRNKNTVKLIAMDVSDYNLETLRHDAEFVLYRGHVKRQNNKSPSRLLILAPVLERPAPETLRRMEHEFCLREELGADWAVRPLTLTQYQGRSVLVLEDPGGEPLDRLVREPMELGQFLRLGIRLSAAVSGLHRRGVIHKEIKPGNVLVNPSTGEVRLTGFGIATRLPRQRQSPESPEFTWLVFFVRAINRFAFDNHPHTYRIMPPSSSCVCDQSLDQKMGRPEQTRSVSGQSAYC